MIMVITTTTAIRIRIIRIQINNEFVQRKRLRKGLGAYDCGSCVWRRVVIKGGEKETGEVQNVGRQIRAIAIEAEVTTTRLLIIIRLLK